MFARLSRSWNLVKASGSVLRQDKELMLFPLVSAASLMLVLAAFAIPVIGLGTLDGLTEDTISVGAYVIAFLFYFSQYFVIFFFNTALVGAAMIRLDGGNPTLGDGLRVATSKIGVIAGYALVAATVGMILRVIEERVGFIGRIVVALLGAGWAIATYLVVPVLAARDIGPIDAVKESATLLKRTWGENLIGQAGMGLAFFLILAALLIGGIVATVAMGILTQSVVAVVAMLVILAAAVGITALAQSALAGIYAAALYRYATTGKAAPGFDAEALRLAFARK